MIFIVYNILGNLTPSLPEHSRMEWRDILINFYTRSANGSILDRNSPNVWYLCVVGYLLRPAYHVF